MLAAIAIRIGEAWMLTAAVQVILWAIAQRTRNAGIVDVGWALSFAGIVAVFALRATVPGAVWGTLAILVAGWSARLGGHLIARGAATGPEEGRYADLRARWAPHASRAFFVFFQAQAALAAVLSIAFVVPFIATPTIPALRVLGLLVVALAVAGETLADGQLTMWKHDPAHRGQPCETGLWRYSRHPNYFFEWLFWVGLAIVGLGFGAWGALALVPQGIILFTLLKVTGIPATEAQALRTKGDAYRAYQQRVSMFVPWPRQRG